MDLDSDAFQERKEQLATLHLQILTTFHLVGVFYPGPEDWKTADSGGYLCVLAA